MQVPALRACAESAPPRPARCAPPPAWAPPSLTSQRPPFSVATPGRLVVWSPKSGGESPSVAGRPGACWEPTKASYAPKSRKRGASWEPGASRSAPHTPAGAAAPELAGLQSACAAEGFPHLLVRVPQTAGGSRPGARRGQQVMAQLCGQRRGRALLALLALLLFSGAEAAGKDLDFHGEGLAGIPEEGVEKAAAARDQAGTWRQGIAGSRGTGTVCGGEHPDLRVSKGWKGWGQVGANSEHGGVRVTQSVPWEGVLIQKGDPERRGTGLSWGRKWMRRSTKRKFEGQRKSTGGGAARPQRVGFVWRPVGGFGYWEASPRTPVVRV